MSSRAKIFLSSTQVLVSILFIVSVIAVTQRSEFLNNIYSKTHLGGQLASVASVISATSDGCYLQSDIGVVQSEGNTLLAEVNSYNTQLDTLEVEIRDTVFQMEENEVKIEELNASLVSEDTIQNQAQLIQNLQTEASKLQAILDLASSTALQNVQILEKGKILTTLNGKIYPLKTYKLNDFKFQLKEKEAIDLKDKAYTDAQKKIVLAQAKYDASMVIDRKNIEVVAAQNPMTRASDAMNRTVGRERAAAQADFDRYLARYNALNAQLAALNVDFDTKYGKVVINTRNQNLDTKTKVVKKELDDSLAARDNLNQEYKSLESRYANKYKDDKRTAVELKSYIASVEASIVSMETEYNKVKAEQDEIVTTNKQETAALIRLKNEFAQAQYAALNSVDPVAPAAPVSRRNSGAKNINENQVDYDANLLLINNQIQVAQSLHDTYIVTNTNALQDIQILTDSNVRLFETLKEQTSKKADLKAERVGVQDLVDTLKQRLETYVTQVCPVIPLESPVALPDVDSAERVTVEPISIPSVYATALTAVISSAQNVEDTNNSTVLPRMQALRTKSESGNYDGIMELINSAKSAVTENQQDLLIFTSAMQKLTTETSAQVDHQGLKDTTAVFVAKANTLKSSYTAYFNTLLAFLTGGVPPPSLETELSTRISQLTSASAGFDSQTTSLNAYIKDLKSQKSISLASLGVSPSPNDIAVPKDTRTISVSFDKSIQEYKGGSITLRSVDGNPLNISSAQLDDTQRTIVIRLGMNDSFEYNTAYVVSIDLTLAVEGRSLTWSKGWGFVTEGKPVDGNPVDGKGEDNTGDESPKETSCDDEIDNDENGLTDCQDLECAYTKECTEKKICGNGIVETPEQCDDGNQIDSDGCSAMCEVEYRCGDQNGNGIDDSMPGETCGCPDLDKDGFNDQTKEECPVQKERGNKTCLICYYGEDTFNPNGTSTEQNRFLKQCNEVQADKTVPLFTSKSTFSLSASCPVTEFSTYKLYANEHSICKDYQKIGYHTDNLISVLIPNLEKEYGSDEQKKLWYTTILAIDAGCFSAGGEYQKGGIAEKSFITTLNNAKVDGFVGFLRRTVNQTVGSLKVPLEGLDVGSVTFSASVDKNGYRLPVDVKFNSCPEEESSCSYQYAVEGYNAQAIICGDNKRFYCQGTRNLLTGSEKFKWKEDK